MKVTTVRLEGELHGGIERYFRALIDVLVSLHFEVLDARAPRPTISTVMSSIRFPVRGYSSQTSNITFVDRIALVPAAAKFRAPIVLFVYGSELLSKSRSLAKRWAIQRADIVVAISDWTARELLNRFGREADIIIRPWIDIEAWTRPSGFDRSERRRMISSSPLSGTCLFVGRLDLNACHKGLDRILQAMQLPELQDVGLAVIGDGDLRASYERDVRSFRLEDRVRFLGRVADADLREFYWSADALLQPSVPSRGRRGQLFAEGFGITFLEATAAGLPCIGSIHGGAAEAVKDRVTGLRVDGSPKSIAGAVRKALQGDLVDEGQRSAWLEGFRSERAAGDVSRLLDLAAGSLASD